MADVLGPGKSDVGQTTGQDHEDTAQAQGQHDFVDSTDQYKCSMCDHVMSEAVKAGCGHSFCRTCWETHATSSGDDVRCPVDDTPVDQSQVKDAADARAVIGALLVRCGNSRKGCDAVCPLRDLQDHLSKCDAASLENDPSQMIQQQCADLPDQETVGNHVTGQATDEEEIDRNRTQSQEYLTFCSFALLGCVQKMLRHDLPSHHEQSIHKHMAMLNTSWGPKRHTLGSDNGIPSYELPADLWTKVKRLTEKRVTFQEPSIFDMVECLESDNARLNDKVGAIERSFAEQIQVLRGGMGKLFLGQQTSDVKGVEYVTALEQPDGRIDTEMDNTCEQIEVMKKIIVDLTNELRIVENKHKNLNTKLEKDLETAIGKTIELFEEKIDTLRADNESTLYMHAEQITSLETEIKTEINGNNETLNSKIDSLVANSEIVEQRQTQYIRKLEIDSRQQEDATKNEILTVSAELRDVDSRHQELIENLKIDVHSIIDKSTKTFDEMIDGISVYTDKLLGKIDDKICNLETETKNEMKRNKETMANQIDNVVVNLNESQDQTAEQISKMEIELKTEIVKANRQTDKLSNDLTQLSIEHEKVEEKNINDIRGLQDGCQEIIRKIDETHGQVASTKKEMLDVSTDLSEVKIRQSELTEKLTTDVNTVTTNVEEMLIETKGTLTQKIDNIKTEMGNMRETNTNERSKFETVMKREIEISCETMDTMVENISNDFEKAEKKHAQEMSNMEAALKTEIEKTQRENIDMTEDLNAKLTKVSEANLNTEVRNVEDIRRLADCLHDMNAEIDENREQLDIAKKEMLELSTDIHDVDNRNSELIDKLKGNFQATISATEDKLNENVKQVSEKHSKALAKVSVNQSKGLEKQREVLVNHSKALEKQAKISEDHSQSLESHTYLSENHTKALDRHAEQINNMETDTKKGIDLYAKWLSRVEKVEEKHEQELLRMETDLVGNSNRQTETTRKEIDKLSEELRNKINKLSIDYENAEARQEVDFARLQATSDDTTNEMDTVREQVNITKTDMVKLTSRIRDVENANRKLITQLEDDMQTENRKTKEILNNNLDNLLADKVGEDVHAKDISHLQIEMRNGFEETNESLNTQMEQLVDDCTKAENKYAEVMMKIENNTKEGIEKVNTNINEMFQISQNVNAELNERIVKLEEQNNNLSTTVGDLTSKIETLLENTVGAATTTEINKDQLSKQIEKLSCDFQEAEQKQEEQVRKLERRQSEEIGPLERYNKKLSATVSHLTGQIQEMLKTNQILEDEMHKLEKHDETIENKMVVLPSVAKETAELSGTVMSLDGKMRMLLENSERLEKRVKALVSLPVSMNKMDEIVQDMCYSLPVYWSCKLEKEADKCSPLFYSPDGYRFRLESKWHIGDSSFRVGVTLVKGDNDGREDMWPWCGQDMSMRVCDAVTGESLGDGEVAAVGGIGRIRPTDDVIGNRYYLICKRLNRTKDQTRLDVTLGYIMYPYVC